MSSYSCVRHVLCCVNLIFWVLGCGFLGVGIWLHLLSEEYSTLVSSYQAFSTSSLIITAGVLTVLLGFLGCCGSWFQSKCLLRTYFLLVIVILLLELTAGTLGFVYRKHIGHVLQEELISGIKRRYSVDNKHGLKEMWDELQTQFECCGVRSYEDWYEISAWPHKKWVPTTCCLPEYNNSTTCSHGLKVSQWFQASCYPKFHTWMMQRMYIVGIICLSFAFIQLFGIISALLIICSLERKNKR